MNTKQKILHILPYAAVVALFLALSMVYFAPQLEGRRLNMGDMTQYEGTSRDIKDMQKSTGEDPQWTGAVFSGMPAYMINILYPAMIIKDGSQAVLNFIGQPAVLIFLALLGFWIMLLLWGVNPLIAVIPAIAYGFSTYSILIIGAGHITKMIAFAYAPMLVGGVVYLLRGGKFWLGMLLTALFAALQIGANHPQITYYFAIVIAAVWINELVKAVKQRGMPRFVKSTVALLAAAVLAVGANFSSLFYTWEYSPETTRGGSALSADSQSSSKGLDINYATAWSYGIDESLNMFIPNLKGGSSAGGFSADGEVAQSLRPYNARSLATQLPAYWGDQPMTAGPTYIGAVAIFLAVLGLFVLRGSEKWWLAILCLLALMLSWGSNFMWFTRMMFDILPGYDKFRAVSTALVIVQWSVPVLAALLLSHVWRGDLGRASLTYGVKWSLAITGGVALLLALFGRYLFSFDAAYDGQMGLPESVVAAMRGERAHMLQMDALRSLLFVVAAAGVVLLFACGKIKKWVMALLLGALVTVDMIGVDVRYLSWGDFKDAKTTTIMPTEADKEIMKDKELGYRVANMSVSTFNDATTSYFHRSVGGYHGAKLSRYQDLIDRQFSRGNIETYNMLNTKYFITADKNTGEVSASLNPDANGAAWFVGGVVAADSAEAEMKALDTLDTKHLAVVDNGEADSLKDKTFGTGEISLVRYAPNKVVYRYSSAEGGLAVFSEIFYDKGWNAYIDGRAAKYFRADYVLRAMMLPAGNHTVEFRFRAPYFAAVETVTLIFSIIILGGLLLYAAVWLIRFKIERRKRTMQNETAE